MNQSDVTKMLDFLRSRSASTKCLSCGQESWDMNWTDAHEIGIPAYDHAEGRPFTGFYSLMALCCDNCGHFQFYSKDIIDKYNAAESSS